MTRSRYTEAGELEVMQNLNLVDAGVRLARTATGDGVSYTATQFDFIIAADTTTAALTVTLPSAQTVDGKAYVITDEGGNAATNAITIATEGTETIDGAVSASISTGYGQIRVYSDGSNWFTW